MNLTIEQVKKVAKLANLPISAEEEEKYTQQLSAILDYVEQLQRVDTAGIGPTYNVSGLKNIRRLDVIGESLTQEEALQNGTNVKAGFFVTKGVFKSE